MRYWTIAPTSFSQVLTCLVMSLPKLRSRVHFMNMLWLQHFRLMVSGTFKDWNVLFFFCEASENRKHVMVFKFCLSSVWRISKIDWVMLVVFETKTYTNHSSRVMTDYSISRQLSFAKNTLDSISAFIDHDLNSHTYIIRNGISEESVPKDRKAKKKCFAHVL